MAAYSDSREYIVNCLLATIVISIVYYFSVVIFEITTLVAEERRKKVSKLQQGPTKMLAGDDRLRSGNRLHEDELTAGGMDNQMNPMLLKGGQLNLGGKKKGSIPGLTDEVKTMVEGFIDHSSRLPNELWPAFQATFAELNTVNGAVATAIVETKKRLHEVRSGVLKKKASSGEEGEKAVEGELELVPLSASADAAPAADAAAGEAQAGEAPAAVQAAPLPDTSVAVEEAEGGSESPAKAAAGSTSKPTLKGSINDE